MAAYASIAEVSEEIRRCLCELLVPDMVAGQEGVALSSPEDKGDASVGIFLYDIQENEDIRRNRMINAGVDRQQYPPMYLTLYYMITAYSSGDIRYRTEQETKILGKILQYFHDHPVISRGDPDVQILFQSVSTEDKMKLWNFPGSSYKVSLFYRVAPAAIDSAYTRKVSRVQSVEMEVKEGEGKGR